MWASHTRHGFGDTGLGEDSRADLRWRGGLKEFHGKCDPFGSERITATPSSVIMLSSGSRMMRVGYDVTLNNWASSERSSGLVGGGTEKKGSLEAAGESCVLSALEER